MEREKLASRMGFILLSAGCAIGIGNVWKFPYMVGQCGGAIFVLIYLVCLIVLGVPVMTIEFALGRASRKSPVRLYQSLEKPGQKWHIHGYIAMLGNYILMMFYTTVAGWMLKYFISTVSGKFAGMQAEEVAEEFNSVLSNPWGMIFFTGLVIVMGFTVCGIGLQNGLEKVTKVMMTALIVIMAVLALNSIFLDGGMEGLKFYLLPNVERVKEVGLGNVIVGAMNQSFFTLSLGIGTMSVFGSYIDKDRALLGESVQVAVLDTFVAFASGLIIFPACFAYGVQPDSGPSLIFITLPNIFNNIPGGRVIGSFFFIFMSFAALSTVFAVFENLLACCMEMFAWSRKKACVVNGILVFVLSLPCILGFNYWKGFEPLGKGTGVLDLEDFLVSSILLPLGSLCFVLFTVLKCGWGWDKFVKEANEGEGMKIPNWLRYHVKYVIPVIILIIFFVGIKKYIGL